MCEPKKFGSNERQSTILRFITGVRNNRLLLGTPRNQVTAKINRVTRDRAVGIRVTYKAPGAAEG